MDPNNASTDIAAKVKSVLKKANIHVKPGNKDKAAKCVVKGVTDIFKEGASKEGRQEHKQHWWKEWSGLDLAKSELDSLVFAGGE